MDVEALISGLSARGIRLIPDGATLIARPSERLTDQDRAAIRARKFDLLAALTARSATSTITPASRHPLIEPAVRAKLEAVEAEARRLGWPAELLWNANFWDRPRGLAAVLDPADEIVEVEAGCITILKVKRDLLKFRRHAA